MKFLFTSLIIIIAFQSCLSQKNIYKTYENNTGMYWQGTQYDNKIKDSVRIVGFIKAVQGKELFPGRFANLIIDQKEFKADSCGNFDIKLKKGKYSIFAKHPYTYGLTTDIMIFKEGLKYEFVFYLRALPPTAD